MAVEIIMPKVDMVMVTGTFVEWLKKEGESVNKGEPLFVIMTDKAAIEVESSAGGVLAGVRAKPDDVIPVTEVIAYILAPGETLIPQNIRERRSEVAQSKAPLKSIRVIDVGSVVAAPFAATVLGDYGAEVIKVEPPAVPDAIRYWAVIEDRYQPFWLAAARNKLPVTLNLKHPDGRKILTGLVAQSDVLLENMRPGTLARLGFSASALWEINKGLIIGRISGYGQTGPYAARPGFGTLAEAMSGFTHMNAHPGGPPTNPPLALADMVAGLHLALGVMMALRDQQRGVRGGQELDLSLYEPLFNLMAADFLTYSLSGVAPQPEWIDTARILDATFLLMGLCIGVAQWLHLRRRLPRAGWWITANVVGWGLLVLITKENFIDQYGMLTVGFVPACITAGTLGLLLNRFQTKV